MFVHHERMLAQIRLPALTEGRRELLLRHVHPARQVANGPVRVALVRVSQALGQGTRRTPGRVIDRERLVGRRRSELHVFQLLPNILDAFVIPLADGHGDHLALGLVIYLEPIQFAEALLGLGDAALQRPGVQRLAICCAAPLRRRPQFGRPPRTRPRRREPSAW